MRAAERAPRARMAFNFVASAVIKSSDGVTFTQETKIEPKDPEKAKKRSMGPAMPIGKSLAEQLAENAEKKDLEWKEANNPFRPPPSMTEDEAMFLEEVKLAQERKRAELEVAAENAIAEYKAARLSEAAIVKVSEPVKMVGLFSRSKGASVATRDPDGAGLGNGASAEAGATVAGAAVQAPVAPVAVVKVVKKKKKKKKKKRKRKSTIDDVSSELQRRRKSAKTTGGLALLGAYGDDDDDDSDDD